MSAAHAITNLGKPVIELAAELRRGEFLVIRHGSRDLDALKKAHARFKRVNAKVQQEPVDTVADVRQWRSGEAA